jgi:hypothetical protein
MKKVKIFRSYDPEDLEKQINEWFSKVEKDNEKGNKQIKIENYLQGSSDKNIAISIFYEETEYSAMI